MGLTGNSEKNKIFTGLHLKEIQALAESENSNLWKGYLNNPKECKFSETVRCEVGVSIPGIGTCNIGFSYTIKHDGTMNPCTYTGNIQNQCDYYQCKRNS